ncbi:MAG: RluA family pseudouridine synthase [Clostridia bacterium]
MKYIIQKDNTLIKDYIRNTLGISSRAMIKLKANGIFANGKHARVVDYVNKGDVLEIIQTIENGKEYKAENIDLDILYEDENLLFINKPYGMPVYPAGAHVRGSLMSAFAYRFPNLVYRPIYRLDVNTSGIIAIAKNKMTVGLCDITKTYLAVCKGIAPYSGEITSLIGLENGSKIKRTTGFGQEAHTKFELLACDNLYSLVKVNIFTGRTHQIRVHMASIGFPLAGDDLYGGTKERINRHALHCYQTSVKSQTLGLCENILADIPSDMLNAFENLFKEIL